MAFSFEMTPMRKRVLELRRKGLTLQRIADEVGTSLASVSTMLSVMKKNGIDTSCPIDRGHGVKNTFTMTRRRVEVLGLRLKGMTHREIAAETNLTTGTIGKLLQVLRQNGYDTTPEVRTSHKHGKSAELRQRIMAYAGKNKTHAEAAAELGIPKEKLLSQINYIGTHLGVSMRGVFRSEKVDPTALHPYQAVIDPDGKLCWVVRHRRKGTVTVIYDTYGPVGEFARKELRALSEREFRGEHLK